MEYVEYVFVSVQTHGCFYFVSATTNGSTLLTTETFAHTWPNWLDWVRYGPKWNNDRLPVLGFSRRGQIWPRHVHFFRVQLSENVLFPVLGLFQKLFAWPAWPGLAMAMARPGTARPGPAYYLFIWPIISVVALEGYYCPLDKIETAILFQDCWLACN